MTEYLLVLLNGVVKLCKISRVWMRVQIWSNFLWYVFL